LIACAFFSYGPVFRGFVDFSLWGVFWLLRRLLSMVSVLFVAVCVSLTWYGKVCLLV